MRHLFSRIYVRFIRPSYEQLDTIYDLLTFIFNLQNKGYIADYPGHWLLVE